MVMWMSEKKQDYSLGDGHSYLEDYREDKPPSSKTFEVIEKLASGGMGTVWKARNIFTKRLIALKRPHAIFLKSSQGRERFLREIESACKLQHKNIVNIHSAGEDAEGLFYEMEFIQGHSLDNMVKSYNKPLRLARVNKIVVQLCDALQYAHKQGIIHRDIKPHNIIIDSRDVVKLTDFGLAGMVAEKLGGTQQLTRIDSAMGTFAYAAPEQLIDATQADERSDIYSLAATIYFILTGETPKTIRIERLPYAIRKVLSKALEEKPSNRYETIEAFALNWQEAVTSKSSPLRQQKTPVTQETYKNNNGQRKTLKKAALFFFLLVVLLLSGWIFYLYFLIPLPTSFSEEESQFMPEDAFSQYISAARDAENEHNWEEALELWQKALSINPESEIAKQGESSINVMLAREDAFNRHKTAALEAENNQEWSTAIEQWKRILSIHPELPEAVQGIAYAERELEKEQTISQHINEALEAEKKEEWEEAFLIWSQVLEMHPDYNEAISGQSRARNTMDALARQREQELKVQLLEEAQHVYANLPNLEPSNKEEAMQHAEQWKNYIENYENTGYRIEEARKLYTRYIEWPPMPSEGSDFLIDLGNGINLNMVWVEGGSFYMGSHSEEAAINEQPVHQVTVDSFWMGKYEVTQDQWTAIMGNNPSHFKGEKHPVEMVSWNDCREFAIKLNQKVYDRKIYFRLPTEAEWEYAARGGNSRHNYTYSGANDISRVAWFDQNTDGTTYEVGFKAPNELNLYDMSGNVQEWVYDRYGAYTRESTLNPTGPSTGLLRVIRGGGHSSSAWNCRVTYRSFSNANHKFNDIGFRVVAKINND